MTKLVNEELNRAINAEKKAINELKDEAKKEELQAVLKNSKYAVLKPEERLTKPQKIKLEKVKKAFPKWVWLQFNVKIEAVVICVLRQQEIHIGRSCSRTVPSDQCCEKEYVDLAQLLLQPLSISCQSNISAV